MRASRRLADDPRGLRSGRSPTRCSSRCGVVRFACDANDEQPIAFEWTFEGAVPAVLENRDTTGPGAASASTPTSCATTRPASRPAGSRSTASAPSSTNWISTRDHSWGVRHEVGRRPATSSRPAGAGVGFRFSWCPMLFERPDGTRYAIHHQRREMRAPGSQELRRGRRGAPRRPREPSSRSPRPAFRRQPPVPRRHPPP